jgi:hypothetical protein
VAGPGQERGGRHPDRAVPHHCDVHRRPLCHVPGR